MMLLRGRAAPAAIPSFSEGDMPASIAPAEGGDCFAAQSAACNDNRSGDASPKTLCVLYAFAFHRLHAFALRTFAPFAPLRLGKGLVWSAAVKLPHSMLTI